MSASVGYNELMKHILKVCCPDAKRIVAKVTGFLAEHDAFIHESNQYGNTANFFMRCVFSSNALSDENFSQKFSPIASALQAKFELHRADAELKTLILVSKASHCLNDLLHRWKTKVLPIDICAVVSNHPDLEEMVKNNHLPFHHMPVHKENKEEQEKELYKLFESTGAELIILARYMQILTPFLTKRLFGKAINIHHSFLPSFKGAKPYHQAYDRGVKLIGATAHYITDDLDEGPIIEQEVLRVTHHYTPQDLTHAGWDVESRVLSRAVKLHVEHRVFINGNKTIIFA